MEDRKEFYIPKNFKADWEIAPGWGLKEIALFVPPALIDFLIIKYTGIPIKFKIIIFFVTIGLTFAIIHLRPTRNNIHAFKHLKWRIDFIRRQRVYSYKKERFKK
jgi:hypothetical protein